MKLKSQPSNPKLEADNYIKISILKVPPRIPHPKSNYANLQICKSNISISTMGQYVEQYITDSKRHTFELLLNSVRVRCNQRTPIMNS